MFAMAGVGEGEGEEWCLWDDDGDDYCYGGQGSRANRAARRGRMAKGRIDFCETMRERARNEASRRRKRSGSSTSDAEEKQNSDGDGDGGDEGDGWSGAKPRPD